MAETVQNPALGPFLGQFNPRKLIMVAVALLSMVFFGVIIFQSQSADYRMLFANMAPDDGAEIVRWLKDQKIPYRLENEGTAIYVPADQLYEARLQLAGSGLPKGGGVGFEIFDKQSFGMTDFSQRVNYLRALQGELSRTIASLGPVKAARVHLVIPEKRVFQAQQQQATASVILKLAPGAELSESQIIGIRNLVSGSIEGLAAEHVTVVDSSGRILTRPPRDESLGPATPGLLEYQVALEKQLEGRAQSLLDSALGVGNSVVRVTANVDFSQQEQTEERYDPDGSVVRSEQTSEDHSTSGSEVASGVPGVAANIKENGKGKNSATSGGSSHTEGTISYEVSKVVSRKVFPVGTIKNLSVAVMVADRRAPAGPDGKTPEPAFVPRTSQELASLESMVRSSLGVDQARGDKFEISSLPFANAFELETPAEPSTVASKVYTYLPYIKYGLLTMAAALVYFLLLRPVLKSLAPGTTQTGTPLKTVGQMQAEMAGGAAGAGEEHIPFGSSNQDLLSKRLRDQVISQKAPSAQIIKSWLRE